MNKSSNLLSTLRRGLALAALGVFFTAAGATFLASETAHATSRSHVAAHGGQPGADRPAQLAPQPAGEARAHAGQSGSAPAKKRKALSGKLNINTATADQLRMLPGVGRVKAQRVVTFRQQHGKFKRVRDLRRVKGFGYKTVQKLSPYLAVKGENTLKKE